MCYWKNLFYYELVTSHSSCVRGRILTNSIQGYQLRTANKYQWFPEVLMMFLSKGMIKYKVHEATYTHIHAHTLYHTRTGYCILAAGFTVYQTQWVATTEEVSFKDVLCQQTELNPMCHGVTTCQGVTLINTLTQKKKRCSNLMPLPNVVSFWLYQHKYQTTVNSRDIPFKVVLICVYTFYVRRYK